MSLLALLGEVYGANAMSERVGSAGELELGDEIFFVSRKQQEDWSHACKNLSSF